MSTTLTPIPGKEYVARALAAYYRSGDQSLITASPKDIPNYQFSGVVEKDGLRYVFLRSDERVIAIYRIDNAERLKRLKRWPQGIDGFDKWSVSHRRALAKQHRDGVAA